MRSLWLASAAMLLAVTTAASAAQPAGPRASSENNWPGMSYPAANQLAAAPAAAPAVEPQPAAPHYVWQEGYDHGGKWHGHWTLVQ
jgi:hypothetical protein